MSILIENSPFLKLTYILLLISVICTCLHAKNINDFSSGAYKQRSLLQLTSVAEKTDGLKSIPCVYNTPAKQLKIPGSWALDTSCFNEIGGTAEAESATSLTFSNENFSEDLEKLRGKSIYIMGDSNDRETCIKLFNQIETTTFQHIPGFTPGFSFYFFIKEYDILVFYIFYPGLTKAPKPGTEEHDDFHMKEDQFDNVYDPIVRMQEAKKAMLLLPEVVARGGQDSLMDVVIFQSNLWDVVRRHFLEDDALIQLYQERSTLVAAELIKEFPTAEIIYRSTPFVSPSVEKSFRIRDIALVNNLLKKTAEENHFIWWDFAIHVNQDLNLRMAHQGWHYMQDYYNSLYWFMLSNIYHDSLQPGDPKLS